MNCVFSPRSNNPSVLCETSQTCEQQSIPSLTHKHKHNNHVEKEEKDPLSVYRIFARAILQCSGGQSKEQDQVGVCFFSYLPHPTFEFYG